MSNLLAGSPRSPTPTIPEELAPELAGAGTGRGAGAWVAALRAGRRRGWPGRPRPPRRPPRGRAEVDAELAAARALAERHARRDRARAELDALTGRGGRARAAAGPAGRGRRAEPLRDVPGDGRAQRARRRAGGRGARGRDDGAGRPSARAATAEPCWRGRSATRPPGLRALLPEVDRAAELARRAASSTARSPGSPTALRRAARRPPRRGRPGSRSTEALVARAQQADARLPGLRAQRGRRPRRAGRGARRGAARGAARTAPAEEAAQQRERWRRPRAVARPCGGRRLDGHGGRARRRARRRRRLPGLRRDRASAAGPARRPDGDRGGRGRPPARSSRPPRRRSTAAAALVDRQERELAALRGAGRRPAGRPSCRRRSTSLERPSRRRHGGGRGCRRRAPALAELLAGPRRPRPRRWPPTAKQLRARTAEAIAVRSVARPSSPRSSPRPGATTPASRRGSRGWSPRPTRCEAVVDGADRRAAGAGDRGRPPASPPRSARPTPGFADVLEAAAGPAGRRPAGRARPADHRARPPARGGRGRALADPELADLPPRARPRGMEERCAAGDPAARGRRRRAGPGAPVRDRPGRAGRRGDGRCRSSWTSAARPSTRSPSWPIWSTAAARTR